MSEETSIEGIQEKPEEGEIVDSYFDTEAQPQEQSQCPENSLKRPYGTEIGELPLKIQEPLKYKIEKSVGKGSYG